MLVSTFSTHPGKAASSKPTLMERETTTPVANVPIKYSIMRRLRPMAASPTPNVGWWLRHCVERGMQKTRM